ncbi:SusC/RagA family TonB-linked outer membrane protein [Zhouia sp. PK063]|uniref:SusC/RagA family TonB-linked outer membrane protein n=1 Tax=Zhouia sp. PK063 TaxID=3373602 RepID=UPI003794840F
MKEKQEGDYPSRITNGNFRMVAIFAMVCIFSNLGFAKSAYSKVKSSVDNTVQEKTISGVVVDVKGIPLVGVNVLEKGTTNGTVTDFDGKFSLKVKSLPCELIFSYIGFSSETKKVINTQSLSVTLAEDASKLDEVVVVGYGTQRKKDVTGAITSVSSDDLEVTKESNALNALAGKVAGLDVGINSGAPGKSPSLLIRGRSSLNFSNEPLIVLDGIPLEGSLNDVNSADIASIEVLKDASSTAIYGARGANGVILITTKRGKIGKARFTFDTYYGYAQTTNKYDVLDANGYVRLRQEALRAAQEEEQGLTPGTLPIPTIDEALEPLQLEAYNAGINANYNDLGFRTGSQVNHQLGVSGGSENVRYAVSLSYFNQEGVFKLADYERYTFRANLDVNATDKLKFGISQQANFSKRNNYNPITALLLEPSLAKPYNDDGTPTLDPLADGLNWNPLSNEVPGKYIDETLNYRYFANIFASYTFIDGLKYTLNVQPQFESISDNDFRASQTQSRAGALSQASKEKREISAYTIENIINYSKIFNQKHSLDATFLYSFQKTKRDFLGLHVSGPAADSQTFNNLGDASQIDSRDSSLETEGWVSYMGRVNYGYKEKYLLTLTGRFDGSSKLSKGKKWGFFPSASFAWRVVDENFMKNQKLFTNLKARLGYGQVGRNPISPYSTFGSIARYEGSFGKNAAFGFQPSEIANPDLKWETTTTFDIGLDFSILKDRISGSFDYYTGKTTDLLLNRVLPATSGFSSILQNVGETKNRGIEFVFSTVNVDSGSFKWTTDFNFSSNKNEIVKLLDSNADDVGNGWFIGQPISVYYDRVFNGIWQLNESDEAQSYGRRPGEIKLKDLNNDGVLNDDDREILGQRDPKWMGGITSRITYKGFDFTVAAYTRQGYLVRSSALNNIKLFGRWNDLDVNYWTPENPSNSYPRPNKNRERPLDNNVLNYLDGSFVRIRNITLGYSFNSNLIKNINLNKLRIYATAQNPFLFTATNLKGFDPEVGGSDEYSASPTTIIFGLNIGF